MNFASVEIDTQFSVKEGKFLHEKEEANFNAMKVGHAFFGGAEFYGPVDFVA